jgi:hypothetical protein
VTLLNGLDDDDADPDEGDGDNGECPARLLSEALADGGEK